ncbi:hypothetical protein AVEN_200208-1 [Araneus ventricosus]|uniref:Uncharacterized protein n=1 Tax=Araneus ventricosus TaxID=182803 RepID=A0A4Y2P532_ARAVE|nr:hypothetical protein AVEN_200208-1 [Araneus ventricosus]
MQAGRVVVIVNLLQVRRSKFGPDKIISRHTSANLRYLGRRKLVVTSNLRQTRFASEGGDSALLDCHKFASSLTRQICHNKVISSQNQTCCKCTCYLGRGLVLIGRGILLLCL